VRVVVATTGPLALHVRLPSALRTGAVRVTVDGVDATSATMREGDGVAVPIEAIAETPFTVVVEPS
jgi:hypothetical protein